MSERIRLNSLLSIDVPFQKMIKNREDYIRRKLIKKEFRVLSFVEVKDES